MEGKVIELKRGQKDYAEEFYQQLEKYYNLDLDTDNEIEIAFYKDYINLLFRKEEKEYLCDVKFSPSSVSHCRRELYFKNLNFKDSSVTREPYQKRWIRNSRLAHMGIQKDLMMMERYVPSPFTLKRNVDYTPAWEENIKRHREITYDGETFCLSGMMDGTLVHEDGKTFGFEFKTKSNTVAQVGNYLLKDINENHKQQLIAYSILFDINDYIVVYESMAKDTWKKGKEARQDIKVFHYQVTEEDRQMVLLKLAEVTRSCFNMIQPFKETDKCLFCNFKKVCR